MVPRRVVFIVWLAFSAALPLLSQDRIHVLKDGETLYGVARSYGVPFSSLLEANNISDANRVRAGQKIVVPGPAASASPAATEAKIKIIRHTVKKGETLFGISRQYGVSVAELRSRNKLTEKSVLKAGDVLSVAVPNDSAPTVAASAPTPPDTPDVPAKVEGKLEGKAPPEARSVSVVNADSSVRWPVRVKELAYMEGKLYGVLITGEKSERVESLTAGTVVSAEPYRGFGRVAIVQSADGLVYVYGGHETLSVRAGDRVASGAELGRLGVDSLTGKPQLFLLVYKEDKAIDPAKAPRS